MKKILFTFILLTIIFTSSHSQHIGGGITFGSETLIGLNLHYINSLSNDFSYNFDAIFFLPHKKSSAYVDYITQRVELNGNYQYNLSIKGLNFYTYTGVNVSHITTEKRLTTTSDQRLNTSESEFEIGLNLGLGTVIPVQKKFDIFTDARYTFHDYDQLVIKGGLLFNL